MAKALLMIFVPILLVIVGIMILSVVIMFFWNEVATSALSSARPIGFFDALWALGFLALYRFVCGAFKSLLESTLQ